MTDRSAPSASDKRYAPATRRNREPIRAVLQEVLPPAGCVLEVGAGTGEHAVFFAASFPNVTWLPTDPDPEARASIAAWAAEARLRNLAPPAPLDVRHQPWPIASGLPVDAVVSINMIHITPWQACLGLLAGTAGVLRPGGLLYLYGPFMRDGQHTAPSNAAFDASLKATDPRFGIRDLGQVARVAAAHGFVLAREVAMPANNLSLVFHMPASPPATPGNDRPLPQP